MGQLVNQVAADESIERDDDPDDESDYLSDELDPTENEAMEEVKEAV